MAHMQLFSKSHMAGDWPPVPCDVCHAVLGLGPGTFRGLGVGYCPHPATVCIRGPTKGYI